MITCDFAILPVGTETTECKDYVTAAVQSIKDSGLNYQLTGMGTQIDCVIFSYKGKQIDISVAETV